MAASSKKSSTPAKSNAALWALVIIAALLAAGALGLGTLMTQRPGAPAPSAIGGPFRLETGGGKIVTDADLRGEPFLVYFGYTHCPDICPTTLAQIASVLHALGPQAKIKVLFITVDPERDTPDMMQEYAKNFGPRFIGLSGDRAAIDKVLHEYRVYARKIPEKGGGYSMDHSAIIYLMNRDGKFVSTFNPNRPPKQAAAVLRAQL
jgi:protein SCO1